MDILDEFLGRSGAPFRQLGQIAPALREGILVSTRELGQREMLEPTANPVSHLAIANHPSRSDYERLRKGQVDLLKMTAEAGARPYVCDLIEAID
jgi:hypothetical protein